MLNELISHQVKHKANHINVYIAWIKITKEHVQGWGATFKIMLSNVAGTRDVYIE